MSSCCTHSEHISARQLELRLSQPFQYGTSEQMA